MWCASPGRRRVHEDRRRGGEACRRRTVGHGRSVADADAVFYSLAYVGFFVPVLLAALAGTWTYPQMFAAGAVIALGCLAVVVSSWRKHLPSGAPEVTGVGDRSSVTDGASPAGLPASSYVLADSPPTR